jgi:hypothetical protein
MMIMRRPVQVQEDDTGEEKEEDQDDRKHFPATSCMRCVRTFP